MAGYLPDGVTDADIDRYFDGGSDDMETDEEFYREESLFERGEIPAAADDGDDYYVALWPSSDPEAQRQKSLLIERLTYGTK